MFGRLYIGTEQDIMCQPKWRELLDQLRSQHVKGSVAQASFLTPNQLRNPSITYRLPRLMTWSGVQEADHAVSTSARTAKSPQPSIDFKPADAILGPEYPLLQRQTLP